MPGSPRVELAPDPRPARARARAAPGRRPRPPRPRPRRRHPAALARGAASLRPHRPAPPRPAAPDPRRSRRRPARAPAPAADPRRPCGRGRGAAHQPQRRAHRRGAHRLPAAHRLGLFPQRRWTPTRGRIADLARTGPTEYAVNAEWVSGLAAWRMGDYARRRRPLRLGRPALERRGADRRRPIIGRRAPTPPAAIPSGSRRGCARRRGSARPFTACSRRARSACARRRPT